MKDEVKAELDAISERRELEMAEFESQRQAQRDKIAVQRMLRAARDEELWLEQRPRLIEAIKRAAAALREKSAQMRTNRAAVNAAKTGSNRP